MTMLVRGILRPLDESGTLREFENAALLPLIGSAGNDVKAQGVRPSHRPVYPVINV
jgi:hypothetical protein